MPLVSGFGIECSPPATDRADLAIRLLQGEPATRAVLRGEPIAWAGPAAEALQRLARRWWGASRPDAPPGSRILWLERDLAESVTGTSLFAGPGNPPDGPPAGMPDAAEWAAIAAALSPQDVSGIVAASVEWLRQTLPSHAWLGYVGIMRDERVRATISGLSADEIPDLLLALGWPGSPATLDHGLAAGRRLAGGITVALDIIDLGGDTTIGLLVRGRSSSRPRSGSA